MPGRRILHRDHPNLVHIFADEMREMDMGCSGNADLHTPSLDRLAAEGARFSRMFTPDPVCCPARASLMTGLLPHRAGVTRNGQRLSTDIPCIAEITREAGYSTGHVGKWHLDGGRCPEDGYCCVPSSRHRGFDDWAGYEHGHRYWNARYYDREDREVRIDGQYAPDVMTDLAIEFIERNRSQPFHLDLSWGPPHFPLDQAKPEDLARLDAGSLSLRPNVPPCFHAEAREAYAQTYAMVENLDRNLGRILDLLDRAGLTDNTIVVFTSDHGDMLLSHGQHYKRRPAEESIRVPFLIRFPTRIAPGQTVHTLGCLTDVVPTCLDLMSAGAAPPTDGLSHAPELTGTGPPVQRDSVYLSCMWLGCRDYDPGLHAKRPWRAVRTDTHMACFLQDEDRTLRLVELYDIEADPYELDNLAGDPRCGEGAADSAQLVAEWAKETGDMLAADRIIQTVPPASA